MIILPNGSVVLESQFNTTKSIDPKNIHWFNSKQSQAITNGTLIDILRSGVELIKYHKDINEYRKYHNLY